MGGATRALAWIVAGVVTGSAALVCLFQLVSTYERKIEMAEREDDSVLAVVAARDLYQGIPIEEGDLYALQIPTRYLPNGVFLTPEYVVGRIPRERILANEFVRSSRLSNPDIGQGLNAVIPRGMRAISLRISDGAALQGLLQPGSYVDVLVTSEGTDGLETRTMLQGMFVMGVDSRLRQESRGDAEGVRGRHRPSVTLLATAAQSEELAHADQLADVHLSLRSDGDLGMVTVSGTITLDDLYGRPPVARPDGKVQVVPAAGVPCRPQKQIMGDEWQVKWFTEAGVPCSPTSKER